MEKDFAPRGYWAVPRLMVSAGTKKPRAPGFSLAQCSIQFVFVTVHIAIIHLTEGILGRKGLSWLTGWENHPIKLGGTWRQVGKASWQVLVTWYNREAERDECWCLAFFPFRASQDPVNGMALPTLRVGLPASANVIWKITSAQGCFSWLP